MARFMRQNMGQRATFKTLAEGTANIGGQWSSANGSTVTITIASEEDDSGRYVVHRLDLTIPEARDAVAKAIQWCEKLEREQLAAQEPTR